MADSTTTITVEIDLETSMPVVAVIEMLQAKLGTEVPEEYRSGAMLELSPYDGWISATIEYERPKTQSELLLEAERNRRHAEIRERHERVEFERLKAKFEPTK